MICVATSIRTQARPTSAVRQIAGAVHARGPNLSQWPAAIRSLQQSLVSRAWFRSACRHATRAGRTATGSRRSAPAGSASMPSAGAFLMSRAPLPPRGIPCDVRLVAWRSQQGAGCLTGETCTGHRRLKFLLNEGHQDLIRKWEYAPVIPQSDKILTLFIGILSVYG